MLLGNRGVPNGLTRCSPSYRSFAAKPQPNRRILGNTMTAPRRRRKVPPLCLVRGARWLRSSARLAAVARRSAAATTELIVIDRNHRPCHPRLRPGRLFRRSYRRPWVRASSSACLAGTGLAVPQRRQPRRLPGGSGGLYAPVRRLRPGRGRPRGGGGGPPADLAGRRRAALSVSYHRRRRRNSRPMRSGLLQPPIEDGRRSSSQLTP